MKRPFLLSVICAVGLPAVLHSAWIEFQIESVVPSQGVLIIRSNTLQEFTLHVLPGAEVTINGRPATLGDLKPHMKISVSTAEPGVVQTIAAEDPVTAQPTATPFVGFGSTPDPFGATDETGIVAKVTIVANSPNAYEIKNVRKGTKITFHYISGKWKAWGTIPTENPDEVNTEAGDKCRLTLALPSADGAIGEPVAIIPPATKLHGFIFEAQQDYPALVLRINGKSFRGPGQVIYDLHLEPPRD